jgi:hypothetical protein
LLEKIGVQERGISVSHGNSDNQFRSKFSVTLPKHSFICIMIAWGNGFVNGYVNGYFPAWRVLSYLLSCCIPIGNSVASTPDLPKKRGSRRFPVIENAYTQLRHRPDYRHFHIGIHNSVQYVDE